MWPTWRRCPLRTTCCRQDPGLALAHFDAGLPPDTVVFPALHGPFGEDGVLQGHLEAMGVPYVGAGVLASAICMDKGIAKSVLRDHGLPVAAWRLVARSSWSTEVMEEALEALGLPLFVKPANLGSSIGVAKASDAAALGDAVLSAFEFDDHVILEEFVAGRELELALAGQRRRARDAGGRDHRQPGVLRLRGQVRARARRDGCAHRPEGHPAGARAAAGDGRRTAPCAWRVWPASTSSSARTTRSSINEVNTMPGFTPISMFPMLWEAEGLPFDAVVEELVRAGAGTRRPSAFAPHPSGALRARPRRAARTDGRGRPGPSNRRPTTTTSHTRSCAGHARSLRWGMDDPVRPR